ncbi:MAG: DoxX family protein [Candidatus Omnitrophota bacterium]
MRLFPKADNFDTGIFILRVGIGAMFIYHGFPKMLSGPDGWVKLGQTMGLFGINSYHVFWGFMAAASELFGGMLLVAGFAVRIASAFLFVTMAVAASMHFNKGGGLEVASHAIEAGIVFLSLIFMKRGTIKKGPK